MSDEPTAPGSSRPGHGSVAEEMAALAEALRARGPKGAGRRGDPDSERRHREHAHEPPASLQACEICPVCRTVAALHTVSPSAVSALADLAHQAEVTLRALAVDLQRREEPGEQPAREDIPVEDLDPD